MTDVVTGKTSVCGIIGYPVAHSLSPLMHNAAFARCGLDYVYVPFPVKPENLTGAIEGMRSLCIRGLNVTIPHKINVMTLLDEIDGQAEQIGAVNTIVNNRGVLKGFNTDASGFMRALKENGVNPAGENVVVVGAGGAAHAISFALAESGVCLTILNRHSGMDRAKNLAARIKGIFHKETPALELNEDNLAAVMRNASILVNASSSGMLPHHDKTPVNERWLKPGLVVFDVVYNPLETRLFREARQAGAKVIGGLDMLVGQAEMSFEIWTGQPAPVGVMKEAAVNNHSCHPHNSPLKTSIVLIGFMGTGKTAVGTELAAQLDMRFVDLDTLIERKAGKSITGIFRDDGEVVFREMEIAAVKEIAGEQFQVIACGGGTPLNSINMERLKGNSRVILLTAPVKSILRRVAGDNNRPLLNLPARGAQVSDLLKFRKPFYERAADFIVNTSGFTVPQVAAQIIRD